MILITPSPAAARRPLPQGGEVKELSLANFHEVILSNHTIRLDITP
ncbi:MAG: hypothetical protein HYX35_03470 [Proteobacteria bacterium]|nr:hypothetical protein [Pseudomonadota bacterium]